MGPAWGPPGSCRPQMGPMWAPWTLLSGLICISNSGFISYSVWRYHSPYRLYATCIGEWHDNHLTHIRIKLFIVVSNHRELDCLFRSLFRLIAKSEQIQLSPLDFHDKGIEMRLISPCYDVTILNGAIALTISSLVSLKWLHCNIPLWIYHRILVASNVCDDNCI